MADTDVSVTFGLEVQRQAFREELAAMRADLQQWKQETLSMEVVLPVKIRDDATMELRSLIQRLQMEASGGITIPVGLGGAGGGVGNVYGGQAAAGQLPMPLIPSFEGGYPRVPRLSVESYANPSTAFSNVGVRGSEGFVGNLGFFPDAGAYGEEFRAMRANPTLGTQQFFTPGYRGGPRAGVGDLESVYATVPMMGLAASEGWGGANVMTASGVAMSYAQPSLQNVMTASGVAMSYAQPSLQNVMTASNMATTIERVGIEQAGWEAGMIGSIPLTEQALRAEATAGMREGGSALFGGSVPPGSAGAAAEAGAAGMLGRNIRGMAAIYIGIKAAEGIYQAVSDRGEMTEESAMQNSSEGAKRMAATLRGDKSNFFGIPYLLRDIGERASGNPSTADTIQTLEDSVKAQTLIDRRIVRARRIGVIEREQGFTEAGGTYMEQNMRSAATLAEATVIGGNTESYAKIDEEHQKQIDAIKKRAERLREEGVAEKLVTDEMTNLIADEDRISAAKRVLVGRQNARFTGSTRAIELEAQGDYSGALAVERALTDQAIWFAAPDSATGMQRTAAEGALRLHISTETAARMDLGTLTRYQSVTGDTYGAALTRAASFLAEQNAASRGDANIMAAARRSALLMVGEGQRADRLGVQSLYDEAEEADTDNPFERRRIGVHNRYLHDISIDQAHSQVHDVVQQSRLGEINRAEDRATLAMRGGTRESLIRSGDLSLNRAPRPELANAMRTYRETMEELQRYSGDNEHDRDMRVAIRERAAEQAREALQRGVVDEGAYHQLRELAFNQYQSPKGSQGSHVDYPGSGNPEKDLAAAAHDLMLFADLLKNAKTLYIAK